MIVPLPPQAPTLVREKDRIVAATGATRLEISLEDGRATFVLPGATLKEATAAVRLADGRERWASDYVAHRAETERITDALGSGIKIRVRHAKPGEPELVTSYWLYANRPEAYVQVEARSSTPISTDRMLPLIADRGVDLDAGDPLQVLFVPFDNDMFVRYHSQNWSEDGESYEVGAVYDNRTRHGLIVGSVDHDAWKSAVQVRGRSGKRLSKLYAYAGATGKWTHDREPHGAIAGTTVKSPRFFVGAFADWRDGLEAYGRANAKVRPSLPWPGPPPTGWNSWSAVKTGLNAGHVAAATDLVKQLGFNYVNMDSFWDNLKEPEIAAVAQRAHALGLRAGIYWTPFTAWGDLSSRVEGAPQYVYRDLALKDRQGEPLPKVDGGWPLDPTHPGAKARNAYHFARFRAWGFDYVKLDFMSHGSFEGRHFDPTVTTGIQAYNQGMRDVDRELKGMFLSLSIAPLFPHGVAHGRRIACDTFADIGQTEYGLNALTYGWWQHGTLYPFDDPDHTVVYRPSGDPVVSETEGRTRLNGSVAAGGMLLMGDDPTDPDARARMARLFSNRAVLDLARKGETFRPIEGDTGAGATDAFVLRDGPVAYLALFNYDRSATKRMRIELARAGLPSGPWRATDLWGDGELKARDTLEVAIEPKGSRLYRLERL